MPRNAVIHQSAEKRMKDDEAYLPSNLPKDYMTEPWIRYAAADAFLPGTPVNAPMPPIRTPLTDVADNVSLEDPDEGNIGIQGSDDEL